MSERRPEPPPPGFVRVRATLAYDGAPFYGFARGGDENLPTVAATVEDALTTILRHPVTLACAGRTDRGVHARGQVVSFDADSDRLDELRMIVSVNQLCGPSIVMTAAERTTPDFDARHSCTGRIYHYRVLNSPFPDPLLGPLAWHVHERLDLAAMRVASDRFIGRHDFSSFCRRNQSRPDASLSREIRSATWQPEGDLLRFRIEGKAFCHQLVRSVVGTLVDVGRGRCRAGDIGAIIAARDRNAAPSPAPSHGLVLWAATYDH